MPHILVPIPGDYDLARMSGNKVVAYIGILSLINLVAVALYRKLAGEAPGGALP